MKFLFDQNLPKSLVWRLADMFADSVYIAAVGLDRSNDDVVWEYAKSNGFVIATKDGDFADLSILNGVSAEGGLAPDREFDR